MHYDLIIIGMGLSGLIAAKTAVEMGKKVLIIGKGMGSLCLFSNTIDVLGTLPKTMKIMDALAQWIKDHPKHPYAKMGPEKIEEALSSFLSMFPSPYSFQTVGDGNCLIPTGAGTLRPTYIIPITMVAGSFLKKGDGLIVGFKGFKDFYADYVADQLECRGITLSLSNIFPQEITATALARLMEKESFRDSIGREIKKHLSGESHVGFPALLGIHDPIKIKKDLEEILGVGVFEIPILPPSIPGMRIFNRFKEWLIQRGVTFLLGYSVSKVTMKGKRCEGIYVLNPPVSSSYSADQYIFAPGRFIGGGLVSDEEKIFEPIFHLRIAQPKSREDWFGNSFFTPLESPGIYGRDAINKKPQFLIEGGVKAPRFRVETMSFLTGSTGLSHPIHQAGILTDSSLRPVDEGGTPILENVWVAGSILAHHNCIDEKSREGIEIATGYAAAKYALGA